MNTVDLIRKAIANKVEITIIPYKVHKITGLPIHFEECYYTLYIQTSDSIEVIHLRDIADFVFPKSLIK